MRRKKGRGKKITRVAGAKKGGGEGREKNSKAKKDWSACSESLYFCITPTNFLVIRLRLLSIRTQGGTLWLRGNVFDLPGTHVASFPFLPIPYPFRRREKTHSLAFNPNPTPRCFYCSLLFAPSPLCEHLEMFVSNCAMGVLWGRYR